MNVIKHRYHWIALKIDALKELCKKEIILVSLKLRPKISKKFGRICFYRCLKLIWLWWETTDSVFLSRLLNDGSRFMSWKGRKKTGFRINLKQDRLRPVSWTVRNGFICFNWFHNLILNFYASSLKWLSKPIKLKKT